MTRTLGAAKLPLIVGVAIAMIALAVAYPFLVVRHTDSRAACLSNVKQCDIGMLMYNADYDDRFPDRDRWVDLTTPYVKKDDTYHCPDVTPPRKKEIYGYAFNSWLAPRKATDPANPVVVPMVYDSINFAKNSSDPFSSFPALPAGKEKARRAIGYLDGHARNMGPTFKGWTP